MARKGLISGMIFFLERIYKMDFFCKKVDYLKIVFAFHSYYYIFLSDYPFNVNASMSFC